MKKQNGFTLVELVIVIAVLGILAGLAIPYFMEAREEAAKKECLANRTQILRMFHAQQAQGYSGDLTAFWRRLLKKKTTKINILPLFPNVRITEHTVSLVILWSALLKSIMKMILF